MAENNPEVMTRLATKLGLSPKLQFYDIYSFDEPELLAFIPRPVLALLVIIPLTPGVGRRPQRRGCRKKRLRRVRPRRAGHLVQADHRERLRLDRSSRQRHQRTGCRLRSARFEPRGHPQPCDTAADDRTRRHAVQ